MQNFIFHTPTKVVFGKQAEDSVGALVKEQNCQKVLVHYGSKSAEKSGLLARVTHALEQEGISYVTLGGVVPNPRLSLVYEGIALCKKEGVDFILAVGGGSAIDSAKAIGYGVANDFDVWQLYDKLETAKACLPIGCVLTLAAAGSEMSDSSVITKDEGGIKRGYSSPFCRCKFAVMNPELTYSLPPYQTACGAVDIMMHTMERFFVTEETMALTDSLAVSLLRTVLANAPILMKEPENYQARAELMWAGSLAHNSLMNCGGPNGDWATHQLEHELGGMFDVAHGAGLAAIWGAWARGVYLAKPERFAAFARQVFDIPCNGDAKETARKGIEAMEAFYRSIEMPTTIGEMGITLTQAQVDELSRKCCFRGRTIGQFRILDEAAVREIYLAAR